MTVVESEPHPQHIGLLDRTAARGLDLVRALCKCPTIAAYFLLEAAHDPFKARRLWDQMETLPFLWALVPRAAWHHALVFYRGSLGGIPEAARQEFEARAFEGVMALYPAFAPILDDWLGTWRALAPHLQAFHHTTFNKRIHDERAGTAANDGGVPTFGLFQRHASPAANGEPWPQVLVLWGAGGASLQLPREHHAGHLPTLTAPWMLADRVWNNGGNDLSTQDIGNIRKIREFDRDWFDNALTLALSQHLCNLPPVIS